MLLGLCFSLFCEHKTKTSYTNIITMGRPLFVSSCAIVLFGVLTYHLGIFDRPAFVYHEDIVLEDDDDNKNMKEMYVILATTTTKDIGGNVGRMLQGTSSALESSNAEEPLEAAAKMYGAPDGASKLSIGLYFDDPSTTDNPRWGIGWAVALSTWKEAKELQKSVQENYQDKESIRISRFGPNPILKATIPWRHWFTPMIAPMLHWSRAFKAYEEGGYKNKFNKNTGTNDADDVNKSSCAEAIACEVYVTGPNDSMGYIDYLVLMGDGERYLDDCFPPDTSKDAAAVGVEIKQE